MLKTKKTLNKNLRTLIIIATPIVAILIAGTVYNSLQTKEPNEESIIQSNSTEVKEKKITQTQLRSALTGELIANKPTQPVTAVMIENSPAARPQSGLKDAGVVYEAVTEGGITRYLAVYSEKRPDIIGPVRSLRPYYIDWLSSYSASVAHVGGSTEALKIIRDGTHKDLDQFFNPSGYWRSSDRYAPHNMYTSFQKLDALNAKKGFRAQDFTGFSRKDESPSKIPNATKITVPFSSGTYESSYTYNTKTNSYIRSLNGSPHQDREKGQIVPKSIVVLTVKMRTIDKKSDKQAIQTVGTNTVHIFQDGTVTEGTWQKASTKDQYVFKNKQGEEIKLNHGQTWVAAMPDWKNVSWQ